MFTNLYSTCIYYNLTVLVYQLLLAVTYIPYTSLMKLISLFELNADPFKKVNACTFFNIYTNLSLFFLPSLTPKVHYVMYDPFVV